MTRFLNNVNSSANSLVFSLNNVFDNGRTIVNSKIGTADKYRTILSVFDRNMLLFPDISEVSLILDNNEGYFCEKNGSFQPYRVQDEALEEYLSLNPTVTGKWIWEEGRKGICFLKQLNRIDTNKPVGFIKLYLKESTIYGNYIDRTDGLFNFYLVDEDEKLVTTNHGEQYKDLIGRDVSEKINKLLQDTRYRCETQKLPYGWKLVSAANMSLGMRYLQSITRNLVILWGLLMATALLVGVLLLNKLMESIVLLSRHMTSARSDTLPQKIEEPGTGDEIDYLIASFNQMVTKNESLLEKIRQEEDEKRYMELALLQAQIKPHFLYNTLDTAFCLNEIGEHNAASHVIKQLADYYRLVLNSGQELIPFSEELLALDRYLDIQSIRYGDQMTYQIRADEEMNSFLIPKMTLQPLVENAIYHGIKPLRRQGHILISGEMTEDEIYICVIDDGVGLSKEQFDRLVTDETANTGNIGFGLKSTVDRLKLFYNDKAKVSLGDAEIGTMIEIVISMPDKDTDKEKMVEV